MNRNRTQIRPAIMQDYLPLCDLMKIVDRLHADQFPDRYKVPQDGLVRSQEYIRKTIDDLNSQIFIAVIDDVLVGYLEVVLTETTDFPILVHRLFAVIDNLGVNPEYINQGIATALMNTAEVWAKSKGANNLELNVYLFNTNAIHLYQKLGYLPILYKMSKTLE